MSVFKLTDSIWYIEDALPEQMLQRFLVYVRSIQEDVGLTRLYEIGSCNVSFWYPFARGPSHIIENVVETLRPHASPSPSCIGAEWWFNIRPTSKGMQSHFDKDESLRKRTGEMRSPDRSSVFYLSDVGQPTFCTNRTLNDAFPVSGKLDHSPHRIHVFVPPKVNRYLVFGGDLWHGSARPQNTTIVVKEDQHKPRVVLAINWWNQKPEAPGCMELPTSVIGKFYEFSTQKKSGDREKY